MRLIRKSRVRGRARPVVVLLVALFLALAVGAYFLWRAEVLPGIWDLQHWGQDIEGEAHIARTAHRVVRLAEFDKEEFSVEAVVFLGSSTIERFPLDEIFEGAPVLNRGIGDEPTKLLLDRIDRGIDWAQANGVVIYSGSVELRRLGFQADEIVARVEQVLIAVEARATGRPVLLLGLLSQRDLTEIGRENLKRTNLGLQQLAMRRGVVFIDTARAPLTGSAGRLGDEYSVDRLHLNWLGYQVLGRWIRQNGGPLAELLSP